MKNGIKGWLKLLVVPLLIAPSVVGDELRVGMGFGQQVGTPVSQDNAVIDVLYDFRDFNWKALQLSLGVGVSWLWNDFGSDDVLIGSIIPTFRVYLHDGERFKPYVFASPAPSYLTETKLGRQILGGYFAFSGYYGAGAYIGCNKLWSVSWCWRHISNAGIFDPNAGIDVPFCLIVGRRF